MKYTATTLMSLLLLGVCSARTMDMKRPLQDETADMDESRKMEDPMRRDEQESKSMQDYRRDDKQNRAHDKDSMDRFREPMYKKVGNMDQTIRRSDKAHTTSFEDLPFLADPVDVGSVEDKFTLATVTYQNIQLHGLGTAYHGELSLNVNGREAVLTIKLKDTEIKGQYSASDLIRKTNGDFFIKLTGDVSYRQTYHYHEENGYINFEHSSGEFKYGSSDSHYENIGFFAQLFQGTLGRVLLQSVNEKVNDELYTKLSSKVQQYVQQYLQGQQHDSLEKTMPEGINNAINGIQRMLAMSGATNLDLTSDNDEMVYHKLHAKISSIKLHGLEKFYVAGSEISDEKDMTRAKIRLAVRKPKATAIVSVHDALDENAPFQKLNVDFNMEQILTELALDKPVRQSGVELRSIETYVNRIEPMDIEKYEDEVSTLVKQKLSSQVKQNIEKGLKKFIQTELAAVVTQGVMPPIQERRA